MHNINIKLISCKGDHFISHAYLVYKHIILPIGVYIDNKTLSSR